MASITLSQYITFENWTADLNITAPRLTIPTLMKGQSWWSWANDFIAVNSISGIVIPTKAIFPEENDWRKWAYTLIQSTNTQ